MGRGDRGALPILGLAPGREWEARPLSDPRTVCPRILIVDWDIHHGQGIQYIFEDDPR